MDAANLQKSVFCVIHRSAFLSGSDRGHQLDKYILVGSYQSMGLGSVCERALTDSTGHEGDIRAGNLQFIFFNLLFHLHHAAIA